jgi:hypothetical protein
LIFVKARQARSARVLSGGTAQYIWNVPSTQEFPDGRNAEHSETKGHQPVQNGGCTGHNQSFHFDPFPINDLNRGNIWNV